MWSAPCHPKARDITSSSLLIFIPLIILTGLVHSIQPMFVSFCPPSDFIHHSTFSLDLSATFVQPCHPVPMRFMFTEPPAGMCKSLPHTSRSLHTENTLDIDSDKRSLIQLQRQSSRLLVGISFSLPGMSGDTASDVPLPVCSHT